MYNTLFNSYGIFYPKRQNFLEKPSIPTWDDIFIEIPKEKKNLYLKYFKKLFKKRAKILRKRAKRGKFPLIKLGRKNLSKCNLVKKSGLKSQILSLNFNLTKKDPQNLWFLSKPKSYTPLKITKYNIKKLGGYSQYHEKVFFSK